jgi:4-hydroxybutyrate CoA-transferase
MESGVINGERKTLHPRQGGGVVRAGTQRLFDCIHENPSFEFRPDQLHQRPICGCAERRMVAINSALQVDLTGQVCADSLGTRPYSGFGGQMDFIRGAARSKGGVPIIALPATAMHGDGVADCAGAGAGRGRGHFARRCALRGDRARHRLPAWKTLRERAQALIAIADPRFQQELEDFAVRAHYLEREKAAAAFGLKRGRSPIGAAE